MRGPCAKRRVTCIIITRNPIEVWGGENDCANPQKVCPRLPGEGYEKCKTICQQNGHAEMQALAAAQAADGVDLTGADVFIQGHYWICEPCGKALKDAGIKKITIDL